MTKLYITGTTWAGCRMWNVVKINYDSSFAQIICKVLGDNIQDGYIHPNWLRELSRGIRKLQLTRLSPK